MIDAQNQAILQDIVRREGRTLLLYIGDAFPWTTFENQAQLDALRRAITEVGEAVTAIGRLLAKNRVPPPPLAPYPQAFTTLNFVALSYLVPRLIAAERPSTAALEQDLPRLTHAAAREAVHHLLNRKLDASVCLQLIQDNLQAATTQPAPA